MTPEEQIAALEEATDYLDNKIAVGNTIYCPDMARDILAPMFAKIVVLEAENAALRANNQTLDQVMSDIALDLGCACDNESILEAIHALRRRLVVDDAMVKRSEIAYGEEFHRTIRRESSSYCCMLTALTAALANKDRPK